MYNWEFTVHVEHESILGKGNSMSGEQPKAEEKEILSKSKKNSLEAVSPETKISE